MKLSLGPHRCRKNTYNMCTSKHMCIQQTPKMRISWQHEFIYFALQKWTHHHPNYYLSSTPVDRHERTTRMHPTEFFSTCMCLAVEEKSVIHTMSTDDCGHHSQQHVSDVTWMSVVDDWRPWMCESSFSRLGLEGTLLSFLSITQVLDWYRMWL